MASVLSSLLQRSSIEDHEEVVKACNAALRESKTDGATQQVKVVALLHLNRFDDAIRLFEEGGEKLKSRAQLEYAYTLYKTGQLEQAEQIAGKLDSRGAKHLEAQASYRLENFASAASIYRDLSARSGNEVNDIRINLNATYAQLLWKKEHDLVKKGKAEREDLEAFETAYNTACIAVARGELREADILLKRAKDLCNALDEFTPEQKQEELLPITVQQLYVLNALEKYEEAEALSSEIAIESIPDLSTRKIAQTNKLASATNQTNPYMTQRILSSGVSLSRSDSLFEFQQRMTEKNQIAVALASSKYEGIVRSTEERLSDQSPASVDQKINAASCANAAAHAQNQLGKIGLKAILPLLDKRPTDVGLVATIMQLYLLTENQGAALQVLEKLLKRLDESKTAAEQEVRYSPGLVAIIVSLYSREGRKAHIRMELSRAAAYWKHKSKSSSNLLKSAGLSLLESGVKDDLLKAGELFKELQKANPSDTFARAGYVASYATLDPSKVASDAQSLTAIERLTSGIDVDALENAGIPQTGASTSNLLKRKRAGAPLSKPKKKRMRKSKLPKNFSPEKKPDPERWLPLRDRSTYKPKGKKGKQKQAALTQGASEKGAEGAGAGGEPAKSSVVTAPSGGGKSKKKSKKK